MSDSYTLKQPKTCQLWCASFGPGVLHEWREPQHREFQERDVWSLFNSFTSAMKDGNVAELPKRTEALHGLLDVAVGLN